MLKYIFILFTFFNACTYDFNLREGDLLFQDLDDSPICDAIELVTPGYKNGNFSHIGLIVSDNSKLLVLEAIPPKIILTEVNDFLSRSKDKDGNPKVIVGRLKEKYRHTIKNAIEFSKNKLGESYDNLFLINNNSYYCSELIYEAFLKDSIFNLYKMKFVHPENGEILPVWEEYYNNLNKEIPQNELGINPGVISISNKIDIIYIYGAPDGMKN